MADLTGDDVGGDPEGRVQAPVNEVGLSIAIARQTVLTAPMFPQVLGPWWNSHPRVETVPPYVMPHEPPGVPLTRQQGPQFNLLTSGLEPRYWLHSPDDTEVIQIQPDYIGYNWRRRDPSQAYVRFDRLKENFESLLHVIAEGLSSIGGELRPIRAELTYVNVIYPNRVWSKLSNMHRLISVTFPDEQDYELFSFSYVKNIRTNNQLRGRLHVDVQPGYDWVKDEPQVGLNIVARSMELKGRSVEKVFDFLEIAHNEANAAFLKLLTQAARRYWGFEI